MLSVFSNRDRVANTLIAMPPLVALAGSGMHWLHHPTLLRDGPRVVLEVVRS